MPTKRANPDDELEQLRKEWEVISAYEAEKWAKSRTAAEPAPFPEVRAMPKEKVYIMRKNKLERDYEDLMYAYEIRERKVIGDGETDSYIGTVERWSHQTGPVFNCHTTMPIQEEAVAAIWALMIRCGMDIDLPD